MSQVIQRRVSGSVDFFKTWDEYKEGFGDTTTNFWLGNDNINELTASRVHRLRVELTSFFDDRTAFAEYATFSIDDEANNYTLRLGTYDEQSDAGTSHSRTIIL